MAVDRELELFYYPIPGSVLYKYYDHKGDGSRGSVSSSMSKTAWLWASYYLSFLVSTQDTLLETTAPLYASIMHYSDNEYDGTNNMNNRTIQVHKDPATTMTVAGSAEGIRAGTSTTGGNIFRNEVDKEQDWSQENE